MSLNSQFDFQKINIFIPVKKQQKLDRLHHVTCVHYNYLTCTSANVMQLGRCLNSANSVPAERHTKHGDFSAAGEIRKRDMKGLVVQIQLWSESNAI